MLPVCFSVLLDTDSGFVVGLCYQQPFVTDGIGLHPHGR